jgi:hypothetical protein
MTDQAVEPQAGLPGPPYWVPLSATDYPLNYAGAWNAGTAYRPGDVVLRNGVYYLCATGNTNTDPGTSAWPGGIGTSLPASPGDGQEYTLVDVLATPSYAWKFKYVAAITDAYKWVCIGGGAAFAEVVASEATASSTYVALTTAGPSFTVPRAGIYIVEIGYQRNDTTAATTLMSYDIGATAASDADNVAIAVSGGQYGPAMRPRSKTIAAAATALVAKYRTGGTSGTYANRWMRVTPVRVA